MSEQKEFPGFPIHHASVPYNGPSSSKLETLDVWLPRPLEDSDPDKTVWVVYIHGGAWRDPLQDSTCVHPTLTHLSSSSNSPLSHIAGIASLNYRLSPYPSHPKQPSDSSDSSRNVTHPTHIQDVSTALNYLCETYGVGSTPENTDTKEAGNGEDGKRKRKGFRWIGVGHSCGATLLTQYVFRIGLQPSDNVPAAAQPRLRDPSGLILMAGIYSIPTFLSEHQPPTCPPHIADIYRDIVVGAFGSDEAAWECASPAPGIGKSPRWDPKRGWVMLAYSNEDELVERRQQKEMFKKLVMQAWRLLSGGGSNRNVIGQSKEVQLKHLKGAHDWVWEDGTQVAEMIEEMVMGPL